MMLGSASRIQVKLVHSEDSYLCKKRFNTKISAFGFSQHLPFHLQSLFMVQTIYRSLTAVQQGEKQKAEELHVFVMSQTW